MRTETEKRNQQRRAALNGHRHTVVFHGGWYVIDARNMNRTFEARDIEHALNVAEKRNDNEETTS